MHKGGHDWWQVTALRAITKVETIRFSAATLNLLSKAVTIGQTRGADNPGQETEAWFKLHV